MVMQSLKMLFDGSIQAINVIIVISQITGSLVIWVALGQTCCNGWPGFVVDPRGYTGMSYVPL